MDGDGPAFWWAALEVGSMESYSFSGIRESRLLPPPLFFFSAIFSVTE